MDQVAFSIPVYASNSFKRNTGNAQIAETKPQKVLQLLFDQRVAKFESIRHEMSVASMGGRISFPPCPMLHSTVERP